MVLGIFVTAKNNLGKGNYYSSIYFLGMSLIFIKLCLRVITLFVGLKK